MLAIKALGVTAYTLWAVIPSFAIWGGLGSAHNVVLPLALSMGWLGFWFALGILIIERRETAAATSAPPPSRRP